MRHSVTAEAACKVVHRSYIPDLDIPDLSLHEFIYRESVPRFASQVAMFDAPTSRSFTYQQMHDNAYRVRMLHDFTL